MSTAPSTPVDASFRQHGLWSFAGRMINIGVVACSAFVFARVMPSKADFGTFTFLQSVIALLGILAGVGSGPVAIRWVSEARHEGRSIGLTLRAIAKTLAIVAALVGTATAVGLILWNAMTGSETRGAPWVFACLGLAVALRATHPFFGSVARVESRLKTANFLDGANGGAVSNGLLLLGILAFSLLYSVTWDRAVITLTLANLITTGLGVWLLRDLFVSRHGNVASKDGGDELGSFLSVGVPIAAASLLVFLVEQLDLLFAGWTLSEDALADYAAAKRVSLVLRMPFAMVNMAVTGVITKRYIAGEKASLQNLLSGSATGSLVASLIGALPLLLLPETMLWLGFGEGFEQAADTMRILLVGQIVIVCGGSSQQLLILTKHEKSALIINGLAALFFVLSLCLLIGFQPRVSPEAVAICFTITTLFRSAGMWWQARRCTAINSAPSRDGFRWMRGQLATLPVLKQVIGRESPRRPTE